MKLKRCFERIFFWFKEKILCQKVSQKILKFQAYRKSVWLIDQVCTCQLCHFGGLEKCLARPGRFCVC